MKQLLLGLSVLLAFNSGVKASSSEDVVVPNKTYVAEELGFMATLAPLNATVNGANAILTAAGMDRAHQSVYNVSTLVSCSRGRGFFMHCEAVGKYSDSEFEPVYLFLSTEQEGYLSLANNKTLSVFEK